MKTHLPPLLRPGDTVGIVAPAGMVDRTALLQGMSELQRLGLRLKLGEHLFDRWGYHAGKNEDRLADFNRMIRDDEVKGIFCGRGGYGTVYLLEGLDLKWLRRHPKIIMGASDLTVVLNHVFRQTGLVTFHGPMVATSFSKGLSAIHLESLYHSVFAPSNLSRNKHWAVKLKSTNIIRKGIARGWLMGGCLSLLASSLGTPYEIETRGAILFLEDVNEVPYRIDRMLKQLADAGKFRSVRGIVFGEMLNCEDPRNSFWTSRRVIEHFFRNFKGPIAIGLSSGHTRHPSITLPIGKRTTLNLGSTPCLRFE